MRALVCELPTNLDPNGSAWADVAGRIADAKADFVVLGELPFGSWLPLSPDYDPAKAAAAVALHDASLQHLGRLARVVVSSRPVDAGDRLANEAFAIVDGSYVALHHKHYFPQEPVFFEQSWFTTARNGFDVHDLGGVATGALLCSELMFNEWARHYGRFGASIIAAPRTSGVSTAKWELALGMAAAVSGCYVLSSNRRGDEGGATFGGTGFIFAPGGELLAKTSAEEPIVVRDLDFALVSEAQADWPCYIPEFR